MNEYLVKFNYFKYDTKLIGDYITVFSDDDVQEVRETALLEARRKSGESDVILISFESIS
jgi:hypothetical protein